MKVKQWKEWFKKIVLKMFCPTLGIEVLYNSLLKS
jgi:hypothetical protein